MPRKRKTSTPVDDGNLTVPRMIRFAPEDVQAQNAAAERDGRPWANWARRALAEAALRSTR